ARKQAQEATKAVNAGKPGEAVAALKASRQELQSLIEGLRRIHAAFALYRAAEATERLASAAATTGDQLHRFAGTAAAALKARTPDLANEANRSLQMARHWSAISLQEARQCKESLARAVASLKGTPTTLGEALPHTVRAIGDLQKGNE